MATGPAAAGLFQAAEASTTIASAYDGQTRRHPKISLLQQPIDSYSNHGRRSSSSSPNGACYVRRAIIPHINDAPGGVFNESGHHRMNVEIPENRRHAAEAGQPPPL